jgi:hypothetical protein
MNRTAAFIVLALLLTSACPGAQQTAARPAPAPPAAACPSTTTLDDLIKALDAAVSGPGIKDRTCFRDLFVPDARLAPIRTPKDGGHPSPFMLTVDGWIEAVAKRGATPFYEHQVKVNSEVFGHLAHLWSTYEVRDTPDGKPEMRGINSIQAVNDGTRWRVVEIVWEIEDPTRPIPEKYLP